MTPPTLPPPETVRPQATYAGGSPQEDRPAARADRLPPSRSSPPPSPAAAALRQAAEARPRAARRAAAEARDPAPPLAASRASAVAPPRGGAARDDRVARGAGSRVSSGRDAPPPPSRGPRRVAEPRAVRVEADAHGRPLTVAGKAVEAVRESWLVEDRWWTDAPLRRRYWEVITADGRNRVVFRDLILGRWSAQRA